MYRECHGSRIDEIDGLVNTYPLLFAVEMRGIKPATSLDFWTSIHGAGHRTVGAVYIQRIGACSWVLAETVER